MEERIDIVNEINIQRTCFLTRHNLYGTHVMVNPIHKLSFQKVVQGFNSVNIDVANGCITIFGMRVLWDKFQDINKVTILTDMSR